jgi:DNA-binding transcriptional LysR family regulator
LLREYASQFPGIELSIFEGTDDEVQLWVQSGLAHVGFAAMPIEGVEAEELTRDEWFALVSAKDFADKSTVTLRELSSRRFLMSGGGCERHIQRLFSAAGVELREPMTVKQMPTIHAMVAEGLGVSLVPALSLEPSRDCRALSLAPRLFRRIGMLRPLNSMPSPALEVWMSLVRSRLNQTLKRSREPPRRAKTKGVR